MLVSLLKNVDKKKSWQHLILMKKCRQHSRKMLSKNVATLPKNVDEKMLATLPKNVDENILATLTENVDEKILATLPKNIGNTSEKC
jgi:hypothetical protein